MTERETPWKESQRRASAGEDARQRSRDVPHLTPQEDDGGESILSGRSRERHAEVPDEVDEPDAP